MVHLAQKCNQVNNQNTYWLFEVTKSQLRTGFSVGQIQGLQN